MYVLENKNCVNTPLATIGGVKIKKIIQLGSNNVNKKQLFNDPAYEFIFKSVPLVGGKMGPLPTGRRKQSRDIGGFKSRDTKMVSIVLHQNFLYKNGIFTS